MGTRTTETVVVRRARMPVARTCHHGRIEQSDGGAPEHDEDQVPEDPEGFERWRRASAIGAVGTGIARGLQAVFAPAENQPVIVAAVPGEPPDAEDRIRVILDPDDPSKALAIVPKPPAPPAD